MPTSGGTPLARLHDTAAQLGIIVVDAVDDDGSLLDDDTAAFVACGVCIAVNPGLDDGLRADVLAMALALTYAKSTATADHGGDITAASGFVLISRTRETAPVSALGVLATVIAREHGHDTASAAFEYTLADFGLAQHTAKNARWPQLAGAPRRWAASHRARSSATHPHTCRREHHRSACRPGTRTDAARSPGRQGLGLVGVVGHYRGAVLPPGPPANGTLWSPTPPFATSCMVWAAPPATGLCAGARHSCGGRLRPAAAVTLVGTSSTGLSGPVTPDSRRRAVPGCCPRPAGRDPGAAAVRTGQAATDIASRTGWWW
jgi:hypothetical protein